jgi:hypothetical protein
MWDKVWDFVVAIACAVLGGCNQIAPDDPPDPNDTDGDGVPNDQDNCPGVANPSQTDTDGDGQGNACDDDDDGDGVNDDEDNCPGINNPEQADPDGDGQGNECDSDDDGDGVPDGQDNCAGVPNPDQTNTDGDADGDACDPDDDNDEVPDEQDNCPTASNPEQKDTDEDGAGNACDADIDGDGVPNGADEDTDGDGIPNGADTDVDDDGVANADDTDVDGDGIPNAGDPDVDGDGIPNGEDDDVDGDGLDNGSDTDVDGDGQPNGSDPDVDGDGVNNGADRDIDGDGYTNDQDSDMDGDGLPNSEDADMDGDGINNEADPDDDADGVDDNAEGGGSGIPGDCDLWLSLEGVFFVCGPIVSWDTGTALCPTPGGWHWTASGGAVHPTVSGFGGVAPMLVWLHVECSQGCDTNELVFVRAHLGPACVASESFSLSSTPYDLQLVLKPGEPLPNADAVRTLSGPVEFEYCVARRGQYELYCEVFGHAFPSKWYVVPSRDGLVPPAERYDLGLDKVVQYARGASSAESIARRLNAGIAEELCYNPGQGVSGHVLNSYSVQGGVHCGVHAVLLWYLCKTAGIPASTLCAWGGNSPSWIDTYYLHGHLQEFETRVSFQLEAPRNGVAEADPHFRHHVVTQVAGITCDPSYGATWLPEAKETYEGCARQTGPGLPSNEHVHAWECDHEPGPQGSCP